MADAAPARRSGVRVAWSSRSCGVLWYDEPGGMSRGESELHVGPLAAAIRRVDIVYDSACDIGRHSGNLPALEAVRRDLSQFRIDCVVIAGDVINVGPFSEQVMERVVEDGWAVIRAAMHLLASSVLHFAPIPIRRGDQE
jgi:hypothetical protein